MSESVITLRKYYKRNKVLNLIRSGENVSRHDVKKQSLYSIQTVAEIIEELIAEGLVFEEDCAEVRVGRKPKWLRLNPDGAFFVGVEFNSQMLHCAVLNFVGEIMWTTSEMLDASYTADDLVALIIRHVEDAVTHTPGKNLVKGLCVGVPRFVSREKGTALSYNPVENWVSAPVKELLEQHFGMPCFIENNNDVMAFAYKWLYFRGNVKDYAFVSMRTGVRLAPFINNELILSHSGFSGELGHTSVRGAGRLCTCGRFGCLNTELSRAGLISSVRDGLIMGRFVPLLAMAGGDEKAITVDMLCESVLAGHEDSVNLMKRCAGFLGEALSAVVNLLAPEVIVLSGNLAQVGQPFVDEVYAAMEPFSVHDNYKNLQVCGSAFDKNIGAIGAAAVAMQEVFEFIDKPI